VEVRGAAAGEPSEKNPNPRAGNSGTRKAAGEPSEKNPDLPVGNSGTRKAAGDDGLLLFLQGGCVFRVPDGVQPPKAGSLFFDRHVRVAPGERVLEIGAGLGLTAVRLARLGGHVIATDVVPAAVETICQNALLNGVTVDARLGDGYAPVSGDERFDVICANLPQMPTPPDRERDDAVAAADNGGLDGWAILDRVIAGAPAHLVPGGRLVFTIFGFLGRKIALAKAEAAGLVPSVIGAEIQSFPRIGYERIDHLRSLDVEGTLPPEGMPRTVERLVIEAVRPLGGEPQDVAGLGPRRPRRPSSRGEPQDVAGLGPRRPRRPT
jgi:release factor glutamine methyltransferase